MPHQKKKKHLYYANDTDKKNKHLKILINFFIFNYLYITSMDCTLVARKILMSNSSLEFTETQNLVSYKFKPKLSKDFEDR